MGKGDKRSRRGKIFAGSYGKTRPKASKSVVIPEPKPAAPAEKPAKRPRAAVKVKKMEPDPVERTEMDEAAEPVKAEQAAEASENAQTAEQ